MLEGAEDALSRHGVNEDDIEIAWVPGSFEIPLAAQKMANTKRFDAIICLGAVIRGGTPHFEYVASEVTKGIAQVAQNTGLPVVYGVLTTDTLEKLSNAPAPSKVMKGLKPLSRPLRWPIYWLLSNNKTGIVPPIFVIIRQKYD